MRRRVAAGVLAASLWAARGGGDELAVYRAKGSEAGLFDQYDNDGYSLAVAPASDGGLELRVRIGSQPLSSRSPFPTGMPPDPALSPSPERDAFARALTDGARTQAAAVERLLSAIASSVRYDTDRSRRQDPAAVFASRRAHCVGFSELAVDLLRRVGIPARTVQGILRSASSSDGYERDIGGVYHRWIEIYYPDRGFVFSDPSSSINSVDSRYIVFGKRAMARPRGLTLTQREASGRLDYPVLRLPDATMRVRPVGGAP